MLRGKLQEILSAPSITLELIMWVVATEAYWKRLKNAGILHGAITERL